jgi:hypothetical protein
VIAWAGRLKAGKTNRIGKKSLFILKVMNGIAGAKV